MEKNYDLKTTEVLKLYPNVKKTTFINWTNQGLIPYQKKHLRPNAPLYFSREDLPQIDRVKQLMENNKTIEETRLILKNEGYSLDVQSLPNEQQKTGLDPNINFELIHELGGQAQRIENAIFEKDQNTRQMMKDYFEKLMGENADLRMTIRELSSALTGREQLLLESEESKRENEELKKTVSEMEKQILQIKSEKEQLKAEVDQLNDQSLWDRLFKKRKKPNN